MTTSFPPAPLPALISTTSRSAQTPAASQTAQALPSVLSLQGGASSTQKTQGLASVPSRGFPHSCALDSEQDHPSHIQEPITAGLTHAQAPNNSCGSESTTADQRQHKKAACFKLGTLIKSLSVRMQRENEGCICI